MPHKPLKTSINQELLAKIKPQPLFSFFAQLSDLPRPSKKEERVQQWLTEFATDRGLSFKIDEYGNMAIYKPAQGMNTTKKVMLQAHMDMVTEKTPELEHNFEQDSLKLRIQGDKLSATNTTLGADNGIGLCAALSILDNTDIKHPNLEVLITTDEETGMTGVLNLNPEMISADQILNLDTEEEGSVYVSSAGSRDVEIELEFDRQEIDKEKQASLKIEIGGLRGGHSGAEIHLHLLNSIKLLAFVLLDLYQQIPFNISSVNGGNKRNAIPRDASARIYLPKEQVEKATQILENICSDYISQYQGTEKDIKISFALEQMKEKDTNKPALHATSLNKKDTQELLNLLNIIPSGVMQMSEVIPDLVQTSNNLGVIRTDDEDDADGEIKITCMTRSSDSYQLVRAVSSIISAVSLVRKLDDISPIFSPLAGEIEGKQVEIELGTQVSGWSASKDNQLLSIFQQVHKEQFGNEATIKAVHAGLECGILKQYLPQAEIISFGPDIREAHTPREHVSISSVDKFYKLLVAVLEKLD
jgi:dipeptidase D